MINLNLFQCGDVMTLVPDSNYGRTVSHTRNGEVFADTWDTKVVAGFSTRYFALRYDFTLLC